MNPEDQVPYDEERLEHQYPVWPTSEWQAWNDLAAYDAMIAHDIDEYERTQRLEEFLNHFQRAAKDLPPEMAELIDKRLKELL